MKKFSYTGEFNRVADVVRLGDARDVHISYGVFVGDPDCDCEDCKNFLDGGFFSADDFTTFADAAKAKRLVDIVLERVDEHAQKTFDKDEQYNLRHKLYQATSDAVDSLIDYRDDQHFRSMLIAELTCNINDVFAQTFAKKKPSKL